MRNITKTSYSFVTATFLVLYVNLTILTATTLAATTIQNGIIVGKPQRHGSSSARQEINASLSCHTTSNAISGRHQQGRRMNLWGSTRRAMINIGSSTNMMQTKNKYKQHAAAKYSPFSDSWIGEDEEDIEMYDIEICRKRPEIYHSTTLQQQQQQENQVQMVSAAASAASGGNAASNTILKNLIRGALLRIASDLTGGTVLESIKTRVTVSKDGPIDACRTLYNEGGIWSFWRGTPSRTIEGAIMGALYLVGSAGTKAAVLKATGSNTLAALAGGCMGGVAQAIIMTPTGLVFTSLNVNRKEPGHENDNAFTVTKRIIEEKGPLGMYIGMKPMVIRQASNWASRAGFTEIARSVLGLSQYGLIGEIGSGVIGGLGSCWNTPIETIRVNMQRDVSTGLPPKTTSEYYANIKEQDGIQGLFRGVTPRAIQAIWQTTFMVVVPNILGV